MYFSLLHSSERNQKEETIKHNMALLHEPMDYTSEGSEFLDDALRMKEQPLTFTGFRTELSEGSEEE
jgi:hypothetical protein